MHHNQNSTSHLPPTTAWCPTWKRANHSVHETCCQVAWGVCKQTKNFGRYQMKLLFSGFGPNFVSLEFLCRDWHETRHRTCFATSCKLKVIVYIEREINIPWHCPSHSYCAYWPNNNSHLHHNNVHQQSVDQRWGKSNQAGTIQDGIFGWQVYWILLWIAIEEDTRNQSWLLLSCLVCGSRCTTIL